MYLKSLKLVGFKSFADRTRLEFRPGVTVIVGPNGSGKSNLVDALSWVLGTQSTKSLRTPKMEDVIFAGTATRPSLNRAEATLVIDNAEREIDLDLDEVSITRRLYRDGSSDYELNGVGCRLLDIQDLLSDSGVGRHQHVIIGQGEIGKVLNASPEEHRAVIEEAAGILKHRRRKERAERRLDRTAEDMVRLEDLLGELTRQMRPLKRQARAAERYDGVRVEATALSLYLGGEALRQHDRDLTIATSERSRLEEEAAVNSKLIGELESRLSTLTEETREIASALDRDTSAAAFLETTLERIRRVGSVAHERGRAYADRKELAVERVTDLEAERGSIAADLASIAEEVDSERGRVEALETRFRLLEDEERAVATQASLSPEGALAAVRGELSALESALMRDERERAAVVRRADVLASLRNDEEAEIDKVNHEIKSADEGLSLMHTAYQRATEQRRGAQAKWEDAEERLAVARLEQASARARLEAVVAALENSWDPAARVAAEAAPGALGLLLSRLDVPEGLELAAEAALGPWAAALAFDSRDSALGAIHGMKASGSGAAYAVFGRDDAVPQAGHLAGQAGIDTLIDLLGGSADRKLAAALLGDVVVVEGWKSGWDFIAQNPSLRAVTPEGDLITASGFSAADPDGARPAMLEAAQLAAEDASTELARAESIHTSARRDFERAREDERRELEGLEAAEAQLAGLSETLRRRREKLAALDLETERLDERKSSLAYSMEGINAQVLALRERLHALEGEEASRMRAWEQLEARRVQLAAEREVARSAWHEAEGKHREVTQRKQLLEERLARIDADLARLDGGSQGKHNPAALEAVVELSRRAAATIERRIGELRERQSRLRTARDASMAALDEVRAEHERRRSALIEARERIGRLEVQTTEIRLRREAVVEAIRRDADSGVDDAMRAVRPDLPEDADLEGLLETKLAQLRRMGPINPLAAEEYKELEERHGFLSEQMADIESSRAELRKVIAALEAEIERRFEDAFKEVAQSFDRYFQVLFPGGSGKIRLLDHDDPESGVSIDAQPLGKRVSQMTLLSGGERSLAALAFLFAVFEARPSPFYVLDEVEAALDDTNLRRFLRIVDEFRSRAQLIIVTHQQQTMEAADVLYGVTMEPGGSSQAVRKDMTGVVATQVA